jgi:ubiquitin C-terminal hydrolase
VGTSTKQTKFARLPAVLVIHLVRWDERGAALVHLVQPDTDIHLQGRRYTLNAVVCHVGPSCRGGHYLTFAQYGEQWWLFNDGMRRMAKEHEIAQWSRAGYDDKTYLLMYSAAS